MSKALTMSDEITARDRRDARREPIHRSCDRCKRPGFDFVAGAWLCREHLREELRAFFREAHCNVAR